MIQFQSITLFNVQCTSEFCKLGILVPPYLLRQTFRIRNRLSIPISRRESNSTNFCIKLTIMKNSKCLFLWHVLFIETYPFLGSTTMDKGRSLSSSCTRIVQESPPILQPMISLCPESRMYSMADNQSTAIALGLDNPEKTISPPRMYFIDQTLIKPNFFQTLFQQGKIIQKFPSTLTPSSIKYPHLRTNTRVVHLPTFTTGSTWCFKGESRWALKTAESSWSAQNNVPNVPTWSYAAKEM